MAAAAGLNAEAEEQREVDRILALPTEHFTRRNEAKNALGLDPDAYIREVGDGRI